MGILDQEKVDRLKHLLKLNPRGMTISNLSSKMKMNRNLLAKYLDILLVSGHVTMEERGSTKVFYLSPRIPISTMLEFSSDLILVCDREKRIIQVNAPALELLNTTRESLVGKRIEEAENGFLQSLPVNDDIDANKQVAEIDWNLHGEKRHFRVKQVPTVFENGSKGFTLMIEDITTMIKYRTMLEMREATYRSIVEEQAEQIKKGLYRSTGDPEGRFVWGNSALTHILGYNSMLELQGINVIEIFTEPAMRGELIEELRRNGFVKNKILNLKRKDDIPITVTVTAVAEFNDNGDVVFINGVVQDTLESIQKK